MSIWEKFCNSTSSPYLECPSYIKSYFSQSPANHEPMIESLSNISIFPPKKSRTNICMRRIQTGQGQKGYTCNDCCFNSNIKIVLYCQECWRPEDHIGHDYHEDDCQNDPCDCGKEWEMKSNSCQHHGKQVQEPEIEEEERKKFLEMFGWLWQLYLFLKDEDSSHSFTTALLNQILGLLEKLTQNSLYYIRLVTELITSPIQLLKQKPKPPIIEFFFQEQLQPILIQNLCEDNKFRILLLKQHQKWKKKTNKSASSVVTELIGQILLDQNMFTVLGDEGVFFQGEHRKYIQLAKKKSQKGLLSSFVKQICNRNPEEEQEKNILFLINNFRESQAGVYEDSILVYIIEKGLQFLEKRKKKEEQQKQKKLKELKERKQNDEECQQVDKIHNINWSQLVKQDLQFLGEREKQKQSQQGKQERYQERLQQRQQERQQERQLEEEQLSQQSQYDCMDRDGIIERVLLVISSKLIDLLGTDFNNSNKILSTLQHKGLLFSSLQTYISYCMANLSIFYSYRCSNTILMLLTLLQHSEQQKTMINKLWYHICIPNKAIMSIFDEIFQIVSIIGLNDVYEWVAWKDNPNQDDSIKEKVSDWWRKYLYERQEMESHVLSSMKGVDLLTFQTLESIINDLCKYNQESQSYIYCSNKQYPDPLYKFQYRRRFGELHFLYSMKVAIKTQFQPINDTKPYRLLKLLFNDRFFKKFKDAFFQTLAQLEENPYSLGNFQERKLGYLYALILVAIDNLLCGGNEKIHKQVVKMKNDADYRFKFEYLCSEQNSLDSLLKLKEDKKQEQEKQNRESIIEKGKEKMKKMKEKFKKNNNTFITKMLSRTKSLQQIEEEQCLICHQHGKQQSPLFYLSNIKKGKTSATAVYGNKNKAQTLITTCFHIVHFDCFSKINRGYFEKSFKCPLCSQQANCILPVRVNFGEKKFEEGWKNILISTVVSLKVYWFGGIFGLLFTFLLEAKGLNPLLFPQKYQESKYVKQRIENYALELIQEICVEASQGIKEDYRSYMKQIEGEIEKMEDGLVKDVQHLTSQLLISIVTRENWNASPQMLQKISNLMPIQQSRILQESLQTIDPSFELPQPQPNHTKESLAFKLLSIPQNTHKPEYMALKKEATCQHCKKAQKNNNCLFCGCRLCNSCLMPHQSVHGGKFMMLKPHKGQIYNIYNNGNYNGYDMYFNFFRQAYVNLTVEQQKEQVCELYKEKLPKIIDQYLQL